MLEYINLAMPKLIAVILMYQIDISVCQTSMVRQHIYPAFCTLNITYEPLKPFKSDMGESIQKRLYMGPTYLCTFMIVSFMGWLTFINKTLLTPRPSLDYVASMTDSPSIPPPTSPPHLQKSNSKRFDLVDNSWSLIKASRSLLFGHEITTLGDALYVHNGGKVKACFYSHQMNVSREEEHEVAKS